VIVFFLLIFFLTKYLYWLAKGPLQIKFFEQDLSINDISSQLIDEKTKHFKKEVTEFTNFKKESHNKLEELDKRLIKIEDTIEDLKMAIIRKIGEYGEDIQNLSNEMKATQNSFAKIINPLTTNAKAVQEKTTTQNPSTNNQTSKKTNTKKADSFENYLR